MSTRKLQALELNAQLAYVEGYLKAASTYVINPESNMSWVFSFRVFDDKAYHWVERLALIDDWRIHLRPTLEYYLFMGIEYKEENGSVLKSSHLDTQKERVLWEFESTIFGFMLQRGDTWQFYSTNSPVEYIFVKESGKTPLEQYYLFLLIQ